MISGVDVSSWQQWEFPLVINGQLVDFAIIKVTEGMEYVNPKWQNQRDHVRNNELSLGYYHFVRPGDMKAQAEWFLDVADPAPGEHLWLDWEDSVVTCAQKDEFLRHLKQQAPEHRVGLYCSRDFWINRDTSSYAGDALWIANHNEDPGVPGIEYEWTIHQYSDAAGIDRDVARFSSRAEMVTWAKELTPAPVDPLDVIAQGVLDCRGLVELLIVQRETDRQVQQARWDTQREELAGIKAAVLDLMRADTEAAVAITDEIARRLAN
jgi:GH25 family lysozyme M1 (1,4-beta-N-acetylmuramidase)